MGSQGAVEAAGQGAEGAGGGGAHRRLGVVEAVADRVGVLGLPHDSQGAYGGGADPRHVVGAPRRQPSAAEPSSWARTTLAHISRTRHESSDSPATTAGSACGR